MKKNILVVDDDRIMLHTFKKKSKKYNDNFTLFVAENGLEAVDILHNIYISLVVTDLHMPEMDGFKLLQHLVERYPEIPVIIITAHSSSQSKKSVLEGGAIGYIEKPIDIDDLAKKIITTLQDETGGESLQTITLEMLSQLIEMEEKTCTIRVINKQTKEHGVLFFREGELLDARINKMYNKKAARVLFSWNEIIFSIQESCAVEDIKIEGGLQAILSV